MTGHYMHCIQHDPTKHDKKHSHAKTASSRVCERSLPALSSARTVLASFTFYTDTIPQQRYLRMQHSTTSPWIISIHIAGLRGRSGWQEVNRDISTITGANSVRSRRVNGLYIQDMGNPFNVFFFTKEGNSHPPPPPKKKKKKKKTLQHQKIQVLETFRRDDALDSSSAWSRDSVANWF